MKCIRRRALERALGEVPGFEEPDIELEQYPTPPKLASLLLWKAFFEDSNIAGKTVVDLGCGTCRLSVGAALLGAKRVVGLDVDLEVLRSSYRYLKERGYDSTIDLVCSDVGLLPLAREVDVVVQNPPFGVHRRGADLRFLEAAMKITGVIYSLHKRSTLEYLINYIKGKGWEVEVIWEGCIGIPAFLPQHRERYHKVEVAALRLRRRGDGRVLRSPT